MTMKNIIYLSRTNRVTDCLTVDRFYGRHLYQFAFVGFFFEGRKELFFLLIAHILSVPNVMLFRY